MKPRGKSKNRTAIITGAGSGLGRAIAQELVGKGINCVIMGRRRTALKQTADMISGSQGRVLAVPGDVTVAADRARVVAQCLRAFGRADILVNNAGTSSPAPILEYSEREWRRVMNTNLDGCFFMAKAVIPAMRDQGWGRIINIASVYSTLVLNNDLYREILPPTNPRRAGPTRQPAYHASKGGLLTLTRDLAVAVAPWGITVNAISPGMFMTELSARVLNPKVTKRLESMTPLRRFGDPQEIGFAVNFLASDRAAFITGIDLRVDGGWSIW